VPRVVWAAGAQLVARWRDQPDGLWDPRLVEVATLAGVVAEHWKRMGVPLESSPGDETWAGRAQRLAGTEDAYRTVGHWLEPTGLAMRAATQRAAAVCAAVAAHANTVAGRTRNVAMATRYRAFAADCAAVVAAAAAMR
jgi:hypothetical protein